MRPGFILSRPYRLSGTHLVSRDLRGYMIWVMSPQTRTSFMSIRLVMDLWAIPRETLASPRPTHLHHHHSSHRQQLPPVLPQTLRTRCSHSLSALTLYGMRPRSTESSSHRTWSPSVRICVRWWPTRPPFCSSSRPYRPRSRSSWPSTSRLLHHHSDPQGSTFHPFCLFLASGDTGYFVWGVWSSFFVLFSYVLFSCFYSAFVLFNIVVLLFSFMFSSAYLSHV